MKTDYRNELRFHVAFNFHGGEVFKIGNKAYEFVGTMYDRRTINGSNTIAIIYDFQRMDYVAWNMDNDKYGSKIVSI